MARTWLFNSRGIAKKVKNATQFSSYQIKELGANRECPNCKYTIDNSDVSLEWPGLPAGVKFDPTDEELLDHLAGKVGLGNSKSHMFIDEFIPTLEGVEGICYTHPENLPGAKKDGNSVHFFYTAHNAYATGRRKRRKINSHCSLSEENVRWHKTGKTKPVVENGIRKGWKKIMVLYRSMEKGCRPDSAKWVMHQYHLGTEEEEEDGEMVVSKIFFQIKQSDKTGIASVNAEEHGLLNAVKYSPRTPNPNAPQRPQFTGQSPLFEACENKVQYSPVQDEVYPEAELPVSGSSTVHQIDEGKNPVWWAGESQAVEELELNTVDESLRCHEVLDYYPPGESSFGLSQHDLSHDRNEKPERKTSSTVGGFPELDDIVMDTPPDFLLSDLNFGSQDSITSWLDRL